MGVCLSICPAMHFHSFIAIDSKTSPFIGANRTHTVEGLADSAATPFTPFYLGKLAKNSAPCAPILDNNIQNIVLLSIYTFVNNIMLMQFKTCNYSTYLKFKL